jgi:predicted  nucleic acid-binding Zn-ribbon protein
LDYHRNTLQQATDQIQALMPLLNQFEQMKSQLEIDLHMANAQIKLLTQANSGHSITTEMRQADLDRYNKIQEVWSKGGMGIVDMDIVATEPTETQK